MRSTLISPLAIVGLLLLGGCSSPADEAQPDTSEASEAADQTSAPTDDADDADDADEESAAPKESSSQKPTSSASSDESAEGKQKLTLTVDSEKTTISPTDVYCSGEPGDIHHIIGKTNNQPPLVKAEESDFVMAKTGHGKPFKANQPKGVSYTEKGVSFDETSLGSAVLNGTMTCTEWED